ncbi:phage tail assembly protein [Roseomonas xinghualingensis]|uniref:phage tail assembly protein n=1 Tax=Roseomonas xinghualingensis TaxID=2986475 RepID=UPI0021F0C955|nr:phage tail assembly protein [Roseomonas sp. SXEYE001]MCV4209378.1 phage tail assembly protein [Roseomonas sp. SXEYE001]
MSDQAENIRPVEDPMSLPLGKPIKAHGAEVQRLTFRMAKGEDITACGVPFTLSSAGEADIKAPAMSRMIATLASIPPSSVAQMDAPDWLAAAGMVIGFFTEPTQAKP